MESGWRKEGYVSLVVDDDDSQRADGRFSVVAESGFGVETICSDGR